MNIKRVNFQFVSKVFSEKAYSKKGFRNRAFLGDAFEKNTTKNRNNSPAGKYGTGPYNTGEGRNIAFRGLPYKLKETPYKNTLNGNEALQKFENFKLGNYLDINGDPKEPGAKRIRENNLSFLERVYNTSDKKQFIDGYNALSGFPDMAEVSRRIQQEFINACQKSEKALMREYPGCKDCYKIVSAGFDGISSTSQNTAFPGSDLDKAYVILQGNDNDSDNVNIAKNFRRELWKNTDQRILSYNHDAAAFPGVYTLKQINSVADAINKKTEEMNLHEKKEISGTTLYQKLFKPQKSEPTKYDNYMALTKTFDSDYVRANEFIIDVAKKFPRAFAWRTYPDCQHPSREDIYKTGFILESIEHGKQLIGEHFETGLNSDARDLINLSQIRAIRNNSQPKEKYEKRKNISHEFEKWDTEKQFSFIKAMIKASCGDNEDFEEYFQSSEDQKFSALLKALGLEGAE